jgi:hypothetical protein
MNRHSDDLLANYGRRCSFFGGIELGPTPRTYTHGWMQTYILIQIDTHVHTIHACIHIYTHAYFGTTNIPSSAVCGNSVPGTFRHSYFHACIHNLHTYTCVCAEPKSPMLPTSVAVLQCHMGWCTLLKCNKTNHSCLCAKYVCPWPMCTEPGLGVSHHPAWPGHEM